MRFAVIVLVACEQATRPAEPPARVPVDAALRAWPVAPQPTLPPELVPWPERLPVATAGGLAHYVDIPSYFPRVWLASDADLRTLEHAWGPLTRDHAGSALWWNPTAKLRARFDASHPTPSMGRGIELAPYEPLLDRLAHLDAIAPGRIRAGEWDPVPIAVTAVDRGIRLVVRVDGPPVDEAAVRAVLPATATVKRRALLPALEITYLPEP